MEVRVVFRRSACAFVYVYVCACEVYQIAPAFPTNMKHRTYQHKKGEIRSWARERERESINPDDILIY